MFILLNIENNLSTKAHRLKIRTFPRKPDILSSVHTTKIQKQHTFFFFDLTRCHGARRRYILVYLFFIIVLDRLWLICTGPASLYLYFKIGCVIEDLWWLQRRIIIDSWAPETFFFFISKQFSIIYAIWHYYLWLFPNIFTRFLLWAQIIEWEV